MITRSVYAPTNEERWNQVRDLCRAVRNAESVSKPRMRSLVQRSAERRTGAPGGFPWLRQ